MFCVVHAQLPGPALGDVCLQRWLLLGLHPHLLFICLSHSLFVTCRCWALRQPFPTPHTHSTGLYWFTICMLTVALRKIDIHFLCSAVASTLLSTIDAPSCLRFSTHWLMSYAQLGFPPLAQCTLSWRDWRGLVICSRPWSFQAFVGRADSLQGTEQVDHVLLDPLVIIGMTAHFNLLCTARGFLILDVFPRFYCTLRVLLQSSSPSSQTVALLRKFFISYTPGIASSSFSLFILFFALLRNPPIILVSTHVPPSR